MSWGPAERIRQHLHNITRLVKTGSVLSVVKVLVWGVNEVFIRVIGANLTITAPWALIMKSVSYDLSPSSYHQKDWTNKNEMSTFFQISKLLLRRCHFNRININHDMYCTEESHTLTPPPWARNLVARPLPLVPYTRGHTYVQALRSTNMVASPFPLVYRPLEIVIW